MATLDVCISTLTTAHSLSEKNLVAKPLMYEYDYISAVRVPYYCRQFVIFVVIYS